MKFAIRLMKVRSVSFVIAMIFAAVAMEAQAELTLHTLFSDHVVLQRGKPLPVWGEADAGKEVVVDFAGQKLKTQTTDNGRWMVVLKSLSANAEASVMAVRSGDEKVEVKDVLVGDVWLCSGQSNMGVSVAGSLDKEKTLEQTSKEAYPMIRLFRVPVRGEDERQSNVDALWSVCDQKSVARFSAVGFYFGRAINRDLKIPVGLIQSAMGGTNAYSWINNETYHKDPVAEDSRQMFALAVKKYPKAKLRYDEQLKAWREKVKQGNRVAGAKKERAPREPLGPEHVKRPTGLYNAMIAPLQPFAMQGAIWYQGEANSRPPFTAHYRDLMLALVEDWRQDWTDQLPSGSTRRDFPFYLVQLPNFAGGHEQGWPVIREQMLKFWQEGENTGMVVTIDVGEARDIHPRDKTPVGERLARFARGNVYHQDLVYSGPIYKAMEVKGAGIQVKFDHVGSGLKSSDGQALRHFAIAGEDGVFVAADANIIDKDTLLVRSEKVSQPRAVRYAWSNNPEKINFYNAEKLPASPFRTDHWQVIPDKP